MRSRAEGRGKNETSLSRARREGARDRSIDRPSVAMSSTSQVWETHERIVSETIEEATKALEEEDGQDYAAVMKELRREWELKIIQSGALALGAEVDPSAQKSGLGRNMVKRVGSGEEDSRPQKRVKTEQAPQASSSQAADQKEGNGKAVAAAAEPSAQPKDAAGALAETSQKAKVSDDLDDYDDIDDLVGEHDIETKDILLAQVEKKFKSKNRYRFVFKSGIMQIDGLEYVFEKGNGDFNW